MKRVLLGLGLAGCQGPDISPYDFTTPGTALFARTTQPYAGDTLIVVLAEPEGTCDLVASGNVGQLYYTVRDGLFVQMRPDWVIGNDGGLEGLYVDQQINTYFDDEIDEEVRGTA